MTAVAGLRCCRCAAVDLIAVRPGSAAVEAADLFLLTRPEPLQAWCGACWPFKAAA